MNKSYRIVWNRVRNCLMVVSETTKSQGKAGATKAAVVSAVAAAVMGIGAADANAATIVISGTVNSTQVLSTNDSLDVQGGGKVNASSGPGATVSNVTADFINVSAGGSISAASAGLLFNQGTLSGGIKNSGFIAGGGVNAGVDIGASVISGGLSNSGTITSSFVGLNIWNGSVVNGSISNSDLIQGGSSANFYSGIRLSTGSVINGNIVNSISGSIFGKTGIRLAGTQSVFGAATVNGSIINNGLIQGNNSGISLQLQALVGGSIVNNGSISALNGLYINGSSVGGDIANTGTISAGNTGFGIMSSTIGGSIVNSGSIYGGSNKAIGIWGSAVSVGLSNSGTIVGKSTGVQIGSSVITGSISNSGLISGGTLAGIAMLTNASIGGSIINSLSGQIAGATAGIKIATGASIGGVITNAGLISGMASGQAIYNGSTNTVTVNNAATGTLMGAVNGTADVSNSGFFALQTASTTASGTTVTGSHVNASISGNYVQNAATATLQIGVDSGGVSGAGTIAGNYSQLTVGGIASLTAGTVSVNMDNASAVSAGGTLAGVIHTSAASNLTVSGLTIADNSALVNFIYSTASGNLNLIAQANITGCGATVSGSKVGPCEVAFDAQNIYVAAGGSIGGATLGIKVLAGSITAGGVINAGTVLGSVNGVQFLAGTTFAGSVNNTGLISGGSGAAIAIQAGATLNGGFNSAIANSGSIGGINNAGLITTTGYGSSANPVAAIRVNSLAKIGSGVTNSGTIAAGGVAIFLMGGATINGGITNSGLIRSALNANAATMGKGIYLSNSALVSGGIVNSGTINAGATGTSSMPAIRLVTNAQIQGGIVNTGLEGAIALNRATVSGGIVNSGTVINYGAMAIDIQRGTFAGGISNTGLIASTNSAAIAIRSNATVSGAVSNSGLISGYATGQAINIASANRVTVVNDAGATLMGGVNGNADITNSGSMYLQTKNSLNGPVLAGSHVNASISGNYLQNSSSSLLSVGVTGISNSGTLATNFSHLTVGGIASLTAGTINVSMSTDTAVQAGGTLVGVITSTSNQLTASGLTITDNSALVDFVYTTTAGSLNLAVLSNRTICASPVTGSQVGPCEVAYDNQTITVATGGSIGGAATGIKVLTGAITAGGIVNAGTVLGSSYGVNVLAGSTFTGGITNSGLISGAVNSIYVDGSASIDRIVIAGNNTASFSGAVYAPNAPVTVAGGATYTLNSNFEVSNFNNQGTLIAPVASVATPTITGNLTLGSSGTFSPTVASQTSYTQITVSGNVNVAGALAVNAAAVTVIAAGITLAGVITGSTVSGSFGSYSDNSVLYDFIPVYNGTMVGLAVVQNSQGNTINSAVQSTGNKAGIGAANALDVISGMTGVMAPVTTAFGQMTSNDQISNAVSQTLPVLSGATTWNTMSVLSSINRIIEARHLKNKGISAGEDFSGNNTLWMKPFGTWTDQGNQNGAYGFKANTGGLMFGGDTVLSQDLRAGLGFAWGNSYATSNAGVAPQNQSSNMYQFIGYGSYALTGNLEANFQANGGWNNNNSNRQIGFMGTSAQGSYSSAVWHVGGGVSNPYQVTETTQLIPSARFDYSWIRNAGYNETGASNGLALNVNAETYQTSILGVDGKVVQKLSDHNSVNANIGVGYNFSPTQTWVAAAFQGAPSLQFTTNGVNPGAVMGRAGVGYTYKLKENVDVGVRYDLDFQSQYTNQTATAKAKWMF